MKSNRDKLIQNLFENMSAMKRSMQNHLQAMNRDFPIPHSQLELLFTIRQLQPVSSKQLAQQLYLTAGAVSQAAEGLEQSGFISRHTDPDDRRIQCLQITKKGDKLVQDVEKRRRAVVEAVMQDLNDEELALWIRVQEKMQQRFQAETNNQTK